MPKILINDTAQWEAPVAMPDDGAWYTWDEAAGEWVAVEEPA